MKLLIVEDEPTIATFLKDGLQEEGFDVEVCYDGKEGLDKAIEKTFDIILLDWMLPGLSGIEVCQSLRKNRTTTPIIFLTAKDTVEETIMGLQAGANDFIKKPFHFEELLERIRVQIRGKENSNSMRLGKIELHPESHQVFIDSEEVELTPKEFSLLEYLIVHKEKVCKRTDIIKDVWNIHFEYNTGIIDVNINALRKKLQLKNEELIKTVRGIGYMGTEK